MAQPSFQEIDAYIRAEGTVTIPGLRSHFHKHGTGCIKMPRGADKGKLIAWNIDAEFWRHLQEYMKQDHVRVYTSFLEFIVIAPDSPTHKGCVPIIIGHQ